MTRRSEQVAEHIQKHAAEFLERESDRSSMITVTRVALSDDLKRATILFTAYPEEKEEAALAFAKRQGNNFRAYVKKKLNMKTLPFFEFAIDHGEKNRQRIDELSQSQ